MAAENTEVNLVAMETMEGEEEEDLAVSSSNVDDANFDNVIGHIEDIIMEDDFQLLQHTFMEKYYQEFEDTEENKFIYSDIHKEYVEEIERHIENQLMSRIEDFDMQEFTKQLVARKEELEGEVFEMLLTFSDFMAFKELFLDYKAEKEGRTVDFSQGLTVTHLGNTAELCLGPAVVQQLEELPDQ